MKDLKVFRDPVYNLISFSKEEDKPVLELLDCPEVQRLKRIRQLGLSYFTFPSAVHDRFSHSLGVAYLIGVMVENLNPPQPLIISEAEEDISLSKEELKLLLQMTGLLHDIGHGPFSHAFERAVGIDHEQISQQIIKVRTSSCWI
ncbi:MAG: HD domain-containing protein [Desulfovermiculus sp.]